MKLTKLTKLTKIVTTILLILFTFTLEAQLISCPPDLNFKRDTISVSYGLQSSGTTNWTRILNVKPNGQAKEGYVYDEWIPLQTNVKPVSEFLTTFLATQYRTNQVAGAIEMQAYYCVYVIKRK